MYPHGAYYIKELSAPDGWLLNTEQYPVQLTPENMDAAEEAIAITLDAPILNRLIYLCRSRYARVSKAEIVNIFRADLFGAAHGVIGDLPDGVAGRAERVYFGWDHVVFPRFTRYSTALR